MMEVITDKKQISEAQEFFRKSLVDRAVYSKEVNIGYQGGLVKRPVSWIPELGLWAHFGFPGEDKSNGERFWCVFGFGEPGKMVSINCEINSPVSGRNRRTGGVYLRDSNMRVHLGHRGNINARGRISKEIFFSTIRGKIVQASDGDMMNPVVLVGELYKSDFPLRVRDFILEVKRLKSILRGS